MTLDDEAMLEVLNEDGYTIAKRRLERIRREMNLYRRLSASQSKLEMDLLVLDIVRRELQKGIVQGYSRGYLYTHMRQSGLIAAR